MSKVLKNGTEYFDGEAVDLYEGRFAGAFLMDEQNGAAMSNDELVTFIVTARVESPKFSRVKKTGDLKRSNAMRIEAVTPVDYERAVFLYDSLAVKVNGVNDGIREIGGTLIIPDLESDATDATIQDDIIQDSFFEETPS